MYSYHGTTRAALLQPLNSALSAGVVKRSAPTLQATRYAAMLARSGAIIMTFVLLLVLSEIQDARYKMSEEANGPDPDEKNPRHRLLSPEAQNLYLVARRLQQYDHTCNTAPPGVTVDPATQPACPHKSVTPRTGDLLMADYWVAQLNCPSYVCMAGTTWQ